MERTKEQLIEDFKSFWNHQESDHIESEIKFWQSHIDKDGKAMDKPSLLTDQEKIKVLQRILRGKDE